MNRLFCVLLVSFLLSSSGRCARAADRLNLLLITVDDMSADSIGAFGCKLPGTTPNYIGTGSSRSFTTCRTIPTAW